MVKKPVHDGFGHESRKNKTEVWITPPWIFDMLGLEFDLDPATEEGGIPHIPAKKTFSEKDNGLAQEWEGLVWLNPPYGSKTPDWLAKMHQHRNGIALVFARPDTTWFHAYAAKADSLLFLKGRIAFIDWRETTMKREDSEPAGAGSLLIGWGQEASAALRRLYREGLFVDLELSRNPFSNNLLFLGM